MGFSQSFLIVSNSSKNGAGYELPGPSTYRKQTVVYILLFTQNMK